MTLLAVGVVGRGLVAPDGPVVHADDEALLRGRAAFETVRVYGGRPFRLDAHLDRLQASVRLIGLPPLERDGLAAIAAEALAVAGEPDVALRLYWTPGREGAGAPTGLALVSALPPELEHERARGTRIASVPWPAARLLARAKSTSYAENLAARDDAQRRGADEALLVGDDGTVLEAPTANVWWREGRRLLTPSLVLPILAGVTRAALVEYAPRLGYEVEEGAFPLERLRTADEVFLCSSVREVMPVVSVDGAELTEREAAAALQEALREEACAGS
jgi:branched-subunit amino acid aminotransferase/4-amino-4-deoxychorismate lyase